MEEQILHEIADFTLTNKCMLLHVVVPVYCVALYKKNCMSAAFSRVSSKPLLLRWLLALLVAKKKIKRLVCLRAVRRALSSSSQWSLAVEGRSMTNPIKSHKYIKYV